MHQVSSFSAPFGTVRNPYDPGRVPGGSSGGNGAALAARIVPAALGLDTNGSIRCPSAFCGVAGLRPSTWTMQNALQGSRRKRYSDEGVLLPPVGRLDTIGPMARSVADVAFLDELITGEQGEKVDLHGVRLGVPGESFWEEEPIEPGVVTVVRAAFATLQDAGCTLVEIDFNASVRSIFGSIVAPTVASIVAGEGLNAPLQSPDTMTEWLQSHAPGVSLEQMYHGLSIRRGRRTLPPEETQRAVLEEAVRRYSEVFQHHGIAALAFPTIPMIAPRIRSEGPKEPLGDTIELHGVAIEEGKVLARNVFLAPRLGAAALSVPIGLSQGLPVGLELDALPGNDRALLGLGVAVQMAVGRIPPPAF